MTLPANLAGYYSAPMDHLPPDIRAYFLGAAGTGRAERANRDAWARLTLQPRVLRDLRNGGTGLSLLDDTLAHPILAAPMAFLPLLHPDAEAGLAAAATAQGGGMVLSCQAGQPMAQVRAAGPGCGWFQIYWQGTRAATLALASRAAAAGFRALVLTLDAPVSGVRDSEIAAGFTPRIAPVNLMGLPAPDLPDLPDLAEGGSALFDRHAYALPDRADLKWLCDNAPLPVVVKGVLHPDDAAMAQSCGAAAVIVSNHGGRVLDSAMATAHALPAIAKSLAVPVLVDGGIRRGEDVLKALALGASAVLVGRPLVHGLALAGAQGASHVLRLLRDELEIAMALCGCRDLCAVGPDLIAPAAA